MKMTYSLRKKVTGYMFISPWLIAGIFLLLYPLVFSLILSFSTLINNNFDVVEMIKSIPSTGIANFKKAFVTDIEFLPMFYATIVNTLINTPMIIIFSLLIAIMVSRDIKGKGFFRSVFFLPVLLGTSFVMQQVLGQNVQEETMQLARGILLPAKIQYYLGPDITGYIGDFFSRITLVMWKSGVQIIIALAGIQGISHSLYESARVDGATEWEMFWKITLPMISPILLLNTVYTIVVSFTETSDLINYIISKAFQSSQSDFAYSAAMGWLYFAFILILVAIVFACMRPFVKRVANN